MTLKIQVVSDLHIEYRNNGYMNPLDYITPSGDILILAGDIGSLYKIEQLIQFLKGLSVYFKHILYVPGNSEYYMQTNYELRSVTDLKQLFTRIESEVPNLTVLDCKSVQIGDTCIAGATLWSDLKCEIPSYIVRIYGMTKELYLSMFQHDLKYINDITKYCQKNNLKLICVTHHAPTFKVLDGCNHRQRERFISLYVSNLDYMLTKSKIETWICGHVHFNFDFLTELGTRVVGNMFGKPRDNIEDYRKDFIL